jgi:hypothetical protein
MRCEKSKWKHFENMPTPWQYRCNRAVERYSKKNILVRRTNVTVLWICWRATHSPFRIFSWPEIFWAPPSQFVHELCISVAHSYRAGLRTGWSGVRVPAGAGNFSLHHRVQTGSGAHRSSYPMGARDSFPGVKRPGRESDHSPPSGAEVKEWVELYHHSPNTPSWRGAQLKAQGQLYLYLLLYVSIELQNQFCCRNAHSYRPRTVHTFIPSIKELGHFRPVLLSCSFLKGRTCFLNPGGSYLKNLFGKPAVCRHAVSFF